MTDKDALSMTLRNFRKALDVLEEVIDELAKCPDQEKYCGHLHYIVHLYRSFCDTASKSDQEPTS